MTARRRGYIYRIFLAVAALAIMYGLLTDEQAAAWIGLATAALGGNGLASANTSTNTSTKRHP